MRLVAPRETLDPVLASYACEPVSIYTGLVRRQGLVIRETLDTVLAFCACKTLWVS